MMFKTRLTPREQSGLLYEALDRAGASEDIRKLHEQSATAIEIFAQIVHNSIYYRGVNYHICGSRYEGTVTPDLASDSDFIGCQNEHPIILDPNSLQLGKSFLMIKDKWTYPGYVKLQLVVNGHQLTYRDCLLINETLYDVVGRQCNDHDKLSGSFTRVQGPAGMEIDVDGKHLVDVVLAIKCDSIPDYANAWITRQRRHDWPTQEQLETMSKMGCMVVGAGYWRSCEPDIEWRMSFSLQERVLMSSLNTTQHKVYIVLKMIKKDILGKAIQGESLSSYNCKTCILYAVERTPAHFWIPDNLINCILYCLRLLLWWVEDNFCPNYFIEEQNIFSKQNFRQVRSQLRTELKRLIQINYDVPCLLEIDGIGSMMTKRKVEPRIDIRRYILIFQLKIKLIGEAFLLCYKGKTKDIPNMLYDIQSDDSINSRPKHETQLAMALLQPWLHLRIAEYLTAQAIVTEDRHSAEMLLRRADEHFSCTSGTDVSSVRFAKASILYKNCKYEECRRLLLEIERDFTDQVIYHCNRETTINMDNINDLQKSQSDDLIKKLSQLPVTSLIKSHFANCVVFTRSESRLAPNALQYEMYRSLHTKPGSKDKHRNYWFDNIEVDARVYLYFLQYLVYEALHDDHNKQISLDNIDLEVDKSNRKRIHSGRYLLGHMETAYNLLVWIYLKQKRDEKAIRYFTESLKIKPYHNAAKFLIRDMYLL